MMLLSDCPMTATTVPYRKLSNEELGGLTRRFDEIKRRLNEGTLPLPVVMNGLQGIIEGRPALCPFPVWKSIKLGTCKSPDEYRQALTKAGFAIGDRGNDILDKITSAQEETAVDLVKPSDGDLGFSEGADSRTSAPVASRSAWSCAPPKSAQLCGWRTRTSRAANGSK